MLLTNKVIMRWHQMNKKWYEDKGYIFTKWKDEFEVRVEDLPDNSHALVDVQCDECGEILKDTLWYNYKKYAQEDGKYFCRMCAIKLFGGEKGRKTKLKNSISFEQWCYDNLSTEFANQILMRWDYGLNLDNKGNKLSPKDISYGSSGKGYWFKCLDHPEHKSELKSIANFTNGQKGSILCSQCNTIAVTHPELIMYFVNKENAYKYSFGSHENIPMKCPDCGYEKLMKIPNLIRDGFSCNRCSDGISYPNKFMLNVLEQLKYLNNIKDFETEKTFDWLIYKLEDKLHKGFIDFYFELNTKKYAIEMDGGFHNKDNNLSGQTKEESNFIDNEKDRLCEEHDIEAIRIDSSISELEHIKNNLMQSKLPSLLNFTEKDINWLKCHEYACSSLVKKTCDLWDSGINDTLKISKIIKVSRVTVVKYLKQGIKLGWCDYNPKEENRKNGHNNGGKPKIKVICLTTREIFDSISKASVEYKNKNYKTNDTSISACCKGKQRFAGKLLNGTQLRWMYYDEYLKLQSPLSEELSIQDSSFLFDINEK